MGSVAITKEQINSIKTDAMAMLTFLEAQNDRTIVRVLEKLGRLENGASKQPLLKLLDNDNETIRALAIKNLAKIKDSSLLETFNNCAKYDESTEVRREAVAAIGRLRDKDAIPVLLKKLADQDPKVVLQAVRGLLVFADNKKVATKLSKLHQHPNELVQEVINKKLNGANGKAKKKPTKIQRHDTFPEFLRNTVVHGDVLETLKHVPAESVHLTFTSPPYYNARDYSIYPSYDDYLKFLGKVFKEVHRITKEGRFFVLNTSPIIIPRISRAHSSKRYPIPYDLHPLLVKMGWEFIDDIVWVKPEASVKNRNGGFLQHRKPLAYKPNAISEMLMVYRKKTDKLIDWNIRSYSPEKVDASKVSEDFESSNVWTIDASSDKVHSAVFPIELCNRVIKYYSFVDDLIFDPFGGSGTLARAALDLNRNFFLTEKEAKYIKRMRELFNTKLDLLNSATSSTSFHTLKKFVQLTPK